MNIIILNYSLIGIAGGQEVDHTLVRFIIYPFTVIGFKAELFLNLCSAFLPSLTCKDLLQSRLALFFHST